MKQIFEKWWPDIEKEYQETINSSSSETGHKPRDQRDILEEVLIKVRNIERAIDIRESPKHQIVDTVLNAVFEHLSDPQKKILRDFAISQSKGRQISLNEFPDEDIQAFYNLSILEKTSSGAPKMNPLVIEYINKHYGKAI